ncbi:hypothetical protein ATM97_08880 [Nocardia sp. MH4]|nr:hypothetical protein [Nocardia sp. MH4]
MPAAAEGRRPRKRAQVAGLTAGSHIEHIYTKIGVHSRGSAAVFAMRHGLLPDEDQRAKIG